MSDAPPRYALVVPRRALGRRRRLRRDLARDNRICAATSPVLRRHGTPERDADHYCKRASAGVKFDYFDCANTCVWRRLNVDYLDRPVTGAVRP